MSSLHPVAVYGLEVPSNDIPIPAVPDFPATFRITMAAIDPSAPPQLESHPEGAAPRATLKLIREPIDADDESDDEDYDNVDAIRDRLAGAISDDEDEDEDEEDSDEVGDSEEEKNGGPSDPAKTKKARREAAMKELQKILQEEEEMELDDITNGVNGTKSSKGKAKALDLEDSDDDEDLEGEMEEFVLCTLDPQNHYQQPLDITVGENERVYFKVTGTHTIYLTGNYVVDPETHDHDHDHEDYDSDDMDYDLSPDEDELDDEDDEEEDVLDGLQDPRITEVDSEEEAPKLVKADKKKGKNKRPADDSDDEQQASTLDDLISKSLKPAEPTINGEQKLSKKQLKKLKKNDGQAVATAEEAPAKKEQNGTKETPGSDKSSKKVQFAKNLELGPTGSPNVDAKKDQNASPKTGLGIKIVQGVTVDDKKLGTGPAAKKGDKIGMRYIGKLQNGKVFDSNKKGKPFTFKLGAGEVIKGWDIGVAGMCVGGERRITIPSKLAYGNKGMPGIPANSDLIFDIKMMSVN
ncbi:hypothetical protein K432DRAFT_390785 [Lepidopterella palustris CBS 459.81]|uniref:peptidylprolyl isomerase n=1 Tax=Lepidopterella palustris CBS 459.81 TaxID=1314670 RepID=A0A8E2EFK7_9PEZI|nr:hypothetical protein K432DRAFT_390785 [Lepidopterella palustris CBS 459.81]